MIGVDLYQRIRHLYSVEGKSQRSIARELDISRNTVRKYCHGESTPWEVQPRDRKAPVADPVRDRVKQWLEADQTAPPKQRHNAERIHQRLVAELGYTGSASTTRRLVVSDQRGICRKATEKVMV